MKPAAPVTNMVFCEKLSFLRYLNYPYITLLDTGHSSIVLERIVLKVISNLAIYQTIISKLS